MSDAVKLALIAGFFPLMGAFLANIFALWRLVIATQADRKATEGNRAAIEGVSVKTDVLHGALNGNLAAWKAEAAAQYADSLAKISELMLAKAEQIATERTATLAATILLLQAKLEALEKLISATPTVRMTPDPDRPPSPGAPTSIFSV